MAWQHRLSAEYCSAALRSDEFQALDRDMAEFPHRPGIYELVRQQNVDDDQRRRSMSNR
jgi:hypothetical protein